MTNWRQISADNGPTSVGWPSPPRQEPRPPAIPCNTRMQICNLCNLCKFRETQWRTFSSSATTCSCRCPELRRCGHGAHCDGATPGELPRTSAVARGSASQGRECTSGASPDSVRQAIRVDDFACGRAPGHTPRCSAIRGIFPRKRVPHQLLHASSDMPRICLPCCALNCPDEMSDQQRDVFPSLEPRGGKSILTDVQTVEQILPKHYRGRLARSAADWSPRSTRTSAARSRVAPSGSYSRSCRHAQQPDLQRRGDIRDFVQEQRAFLGQRETAPACPGRHR